MAGDLKTKLQSIISSLSPDENNDSLKIYGDDLDGIFKDYLENISNDFGNFGVRVLDEYRSTVLPIKTISSVRKAREAFKSGESVLKDDNPNKIETKIEFTEHASEPYENTFLRIMGMPTEKMFVGSKISVIENGNLKTVVDGSSGFSFQSRFEERDTASINRVNNVRSASILFTAQKEDMLSTFTEEEQSDIQKAVSEVVEEKEKKAEEYKKNKTFAEDNEEDLKILFFKNLSQKETFKDKKIESVSDVESRVSFGESIDEKILGIFDEMIMKKSTSKSILNYSEYFMDDVSLLFPPVQDSAIEYCLSDPDKIVSKPFDVTNSYLNRKKIKGSLLESIIRIRLDKKVGLKENTKRQGFFSRFEEESKNEVANEADSFSILEKIIIDRIYSAIENFGNSFYDLSQNYVKSCEKSLKTMTKDYFNEDSPKVSARSDLSKKEKEERRRLLSLKVIDDSILALMNKDESYDPSFGSFKTSSLEDGIAMDTLIKAITIPSSYASRKLKENEKTLDELTGSRNGTRDSAVKICQITGIGRGAGVIDLLCFSLAFFTVDTADLLGMLDADQYRNFLIQRRGLNFRRNDPVESLNNFSSNLYQAYNIFREVIK
jgi:hypothetical protein